jgi:hypothetical protein
LRQEKEEEEEEGQGAAAWRPTSPWATKAMER